MDILSAVAAIVKYLLLFIGAMTVLLVVLLVVVSRLSADNPMKRTLVMLAIAWWRRSARALSPFRSSRSRRR